MRDTPEDEVRRLREALLDLCVERGYEDLELEELLARAQMDEKAFHRRYADLDACFAAVLSDVYAEFFSRATEAVAGESGWRDRVRAPAPAPRRRRGARVAGATGCAPPPTRCCGSCAPTNGLHGSPRSRSSTQARIPSGSSNRPLSAWSS